MADVTLTRRAVLSNQCPKKDGPLQLDADAARADPSLPAFLARPEGAPVYHGFVLTDVQVDGLRLGLISGAQDDAASGDAFIVAPDVSRAGLVWDRAADSTEVKPAQVYRYTPDRWGAWAYVCLGRCRPKAIGLQTSASS